MKTIFKIIITLLIANSINAQFTITGNIFDDKTKASLPYVNIGIIGSKIGTVSDEMGNFKINVQSIKDTLFFSYVGYHSVRIVSNLKEESIQVSLKPISIQIDEIKVVSTKFDKELLLGVKNENGRGRSVGFGNPQLGAEIGALIKIKKETFLKSANFVLNHAKGDSLLLRMNIYNYIDGEIGDKILHENIYIKEKQRKGTFTINLEEYGIILNNDVLLTFEWLRDFDESGNKLMTFDTKKSRKYGGVFIRLSKTTEFRKLSIKKKYKPCIYFIGKQNSN